MDKSCVISALHEMLDARLFGDEPWLAPPDVVAAVSKKLDDLGLQEWVNEKDTRATALGDEIKLDLVIVFLGIFNEFEVPIILEKHGLLDEAEASLLIESPELTGNAEQILRPIVQQAFLRHYNPRDRLN